MPIKSSRAHSESAAKVLEIRKQVRKLVSSLPGFVHLTSNARLALNNAANVPDAFHLQLASILERKDGQDLTALTTLTPAGLRELVEFTKAYRALAKELAHLERGVLDAIAAERALIGEEGLRVYAIVSQFTRPRDSEEATPYLAVLKKALGRGRKRRRKTASRALHKV